MGCTVCVLFHETEIDQLVRKGFLKPERSHDHDAVENAMGSFVCGALGPADRYELFGLGPTRSCVRRPPPVVLALTMNYAPRIHGSADWRGPSAQLVR